MYAAEEPNPMQEGTESKQASKQALSRLMSCRCDDQRSVMRAMHERMWVVKVGVPASEWESGGVRLTVCCMK